MNKIISSTLFAGVLLLAGGDFYYLQTQKPLPDSVTEVPEHADALAVNELSPAQVIQRIQSGDPVVLLDVRTAEAYEVLHLQGALLLPISDISQNTLRGIGLGEDKKDVEIIIYGRSATGGQAAYKILEVLGYTNLKVLSGGIVHWAEDSYPMTETGAYTGPLTNSRNKVEIQAKEGPQMVLSDTFYDFGGVPQYGGSVQTEFTVTNAGIDTLVIGDITTSCSCTSAFISDTSLDSGERATLTVIFDPNVHKEPEDVFTRTVFIPTNDADTPEAEVTIQVDILEGV